MLRRDFLKTSSLASGVALIPGFLKGFNHVPYVENGKKLVVIQLSGGNDGLNTCIPFRNDIYYKQRPSLAIEKSLTHSISDEMGLHPALTNMHRLFHDGSLTIINQVGYPNAERSHFRAMDIWHTASDSDEYWDTGWLGRYLDHNCQGCTKPHGVLEIDDTLSLAVKGEHTKALAVKDPQRLYRNVQEKRIQELYYDYHEKGERLASEELTFLYKTLAETVESAAYIHDKSRIYTSNERYPVTPIGKQMKVTAELIRSGVETTVFYVSLSGFDTHVRQKWQHERLLTQLDQAIATFVGDMKKSNIWKDTLIMVFSEFGRRVSQNASQGTDHGKANNVFLIGGNLQSAGMYNNIPSLDILDDGDIPFTVDFRSIYATILQDWLGADDKKILRKKYDKLQLV